MRKGMNSMTGKYYVSMTDMFLSGWGNAEGRKSKLVVVCDNRQQAMKIVDAIRRERYTVGNEMRYVHIHTTPPYLPSSRYHVEYLDYKDAHRWNK